METKPFNRRRSNEQTAIPIKAIDIVTDELLSKFHSSYWMSDLTKPAEETCWNWHGKPNKHGYGGIKIAGKGYLAHRFSYALHHGEIPPGMIVMHKCDNRRCVNPHHLELGTHKQNLEDMSRKKRWGKRNLPFGTSCKNAKLTDAAVVDIFQMRKLGFKLHEIACRYDVSVPRIHKVLAREIWKHVSIPDGLM